MLKITVADLQKPEAKQAETTTVKGLVVNPCKEEGKLYLLLRGGTVVRLPLDRDLFIKEIEEKEGK